jgi:hypothetical protein
MLRKADKEVEESKKEGKKPYVPLLPATGGVPIPIF